MSSSLKAASLEPFGSMASRNLPTVHSLIPFNSICTLQGHHQFSSKRDNSSNEIKINKLKDEKD